jgi:DnaJ-class molecular chaperone
VGTASQVKNYYVILGVPREVSERGIRTAFRDLARRHHPDIAGPEGAAAFREAVEAYRVLSDPEARKHHDARLAEGVSVRVRATPATHVRDSRAPTLEPLSIFGRPEAIRPSADALLDRFHRNFSGLGIPKSEGPQPLLCDVSLSKEEARRGGVLPIRLPALRPCPACRGTGRSAFFICRTCGAEGSVDDQIVVPVRIPPGARSGTVLEVSLARWGVHNSWLRIRLRVS